VAKLEAWVERMIANPPKGRDGVALKVPEWVRGLPAEARASGLKTYDVGKLNPYVAAGMSRSSGADMFALELHRLSAHHMYQAREGFPLKSLLAETLADKINAMRQVRVYKPKPLPFETIRGILIEDLGKGLPPNATELIDRALSHQKRLERTGKVNPYHLAGPEAARARLLDRYRRADGTLDWKRLGREGALREAGGLAQFGLALFLKELAVVAASGDRLRIEEFFDGLATTEFYTHYGLFVVGARGAEVAYGRYLERFVKPQFVRGILRTQLALAAGLALPQLVHGELSAKTFAISLTSLGLSSSAVKAGARGIRWVMDLKTARQGRALGGALSAGRLARFGGWFYTAAELAVVLYLAEDVEERIHAALDGRAARAALGDAGEALLSAVSKPEATPNSVAAAAAKYGEAWDGYRERIERLAREAKLADDRRKAALDRIAKQRRVRASVIRRYGSLEGYAEAMNADAEAELERDMTAALEAFDRGRAEALREIYAEDEEWTPGPVGDLDVAYWLYGSPGAEGDPFGAREDFVARLGRSAARGALRRKLMDVSLTRPRTYEDEARILEAVADSLRERGRGDLADALAPAVARADRIGALDVAFARGAGATGSLEALGE
jgi:hypothetical protein